ncbi:MAG: alcohol dehydrogenase catalytic domain-containing protein [Acidimicrobiaceae bacterium]|nr:alcohol dehydrogenase catalytic domain-containing protein [Acidimicrobiaceae bacterium]
MKGLVVHGANQVSLDEIATPVVEPGYVLVKPLVSGLCGTDLEIIAGTIDAAFVHYPVVLGHEWVGRLADDPDHESIVVVEGIVPCGVCDECRRGATNRCRTYDEIGFTRNGALAEFISVPSHLVHSLNPEVATLDAALVEPMAVVWRALTRAPVGVGSRCLVIGDGTVALLSALLLQRFTPTSVTMLGLRPAQAALAYEAGVTEFVTAVDDRRFDFVVEAVGQAPAISTALSCADRGGIIVLLGLPAHGTAVDLYPDDVVNNDLIIQGSFSYTRQSWSEVVSLLNDQLIHPSFLVTHQFTLTQWRAALEALAHAPGDLPRGKVVITLDNL